MSIFYCEEVECTWKEKKPKGFGKTPKSMTTWFTWKADAVTDDISPYISDKVNHRLGINKSIELFELKAIPKTKIIEL
jgi:hypothetical protein